MWMSAVLTQPHFVAPRVKVALILAFQLNCYRSLLIVDWMLPQVVESLYNLTSPPLGDYDELRCRSDVGPQLY